MFENIIEQGAVIQLGEDIIKSRAAPSMLFYGPAASGKGSSALELARVLSCMQDASWKCSCVSCEQHRYLQNSDLIIMGNRSFSAEISACRSAFLKNNENQGAKLIFIRSIKKLLLRFSPVLIEDDPKLPKISGVIQSLDERLNEFILMEKSEKPSLEKICEQLLKDAFTLENDGFGSVIPISQIRSASYWCRLAPNGKRKILIIENADNMKEEGRNSLLKILEEPPPSLSIVLTTQRREAIMPTILSRLRPYRFLKRNAESEKEVLRRVFQETQTEKSVSLYLDSFTPQNDEKLKPLAAWFLVSIAHAALSARIAAKSIKIKDGYNAFLNTIGERYAPLADAAGFERSVNGPEIIKKILSQSANFENDSFPRFIKICMDLLCDVMRISDNPQCIKLIDIFRKYLNEAVTSAELLNINITITLENLFYKLKSGMLKALYD